MVKKSFTHVALITGAIIVVGPLLWMILCSFKTNAEINTYPPTIFPQNFTLDNYSYIFENSQIGIYFLNTIIYTFFKVVFSLFLCSFAGFIIAKENFAGKKILFALIIVAMMLPFQVRMISLYKLADKFNFLDTWLAIIIPGLMEPFGIFLFAQAIGEIPKDLMEAAKIDGCGILRTYWKIILPLIKPTMAAFIILAFIWSWTDFMWPLLALNSESLKPLEVGIVGFSDIHNPKYNLMMAASTIAVLPMIVVFFIMQRQFIKSITMAGLKG